MPDFPAHYVPGCSVEYRGPTARRGSVWAAVIRRGRDRADQYRATVPFSEGPTAAVCAALDRLNAELLADDSDPWEILGAALSMDGGDRYAYPVGASYWCSILLRRPED